MVKSPCVNVCELGDDNICQGCFRSLEEIGDWSWANNEQRLVIVEAAKIRQIENDG